MYYQRIAIGGDGDTAPEVRMAYSEQIAFADLCDDMQVSTTEPALEVALTRFVRRFGFEWFAYIDKSPSDFYSSASYPTEWQALYIKRNYIRTDPVLISASRDPLPFRWDGEDFSANTNYRAFFAAAAGFNVRNGVVIPIAGVYGSFVSVSLAGYHNDNKPAAFNENVSVLTLGALHYHMQINRLRAMVAEKDNPRFSLGQRARVCLMWVARGKTIEETADILNIHEATVRYHLNDARKRLNATSLPHLVAEALKRGEITY